MHMHMHTCMRAPFSWCQLLGDRRLRCRGAAGYWGGRGLRSLAEEGNWERDGGGGGYRRCKGNNGGTGLTTQYRRVEHVYVHSHPLVPTGYIPKGLQALPRHGAPQFHFSVVIGTGDEESPELSSGGGERGEERERRRERG